MRNVAIFPLSQALRIEWRNPVICSFGGSYTAKLLLAQEVFGSCKFPIQCRAVRTLAKTSLTELYQPSTEYEKPLPSIQDEGRTYPAVVQQARENMRKFEKCVLLTRVGSFYELYFEHADKYGPLLNLKVAQKKTAAGPVSMAGFPFYQLDRFLKILVQDLNVFVAISEEFANNASDTVKSGGLLFDRRVTRTITPGTLIDEKFLDPYENNFLLALHPAESSTISRPLLKSKMPAELAKGALSPWLVSHSVGLAWLDLSTGDFFTQDTTMGTLPSAVARIGPREIIISDALEVDLQQNVLDVLERHRHLVTLHDHPPADRSIPSWTPMLESEVLPGKQNEFTGAEVSAGTMLLTYVNNKLQSSGTKLQPPVRKQGKETMSIDRNSMRALEVLETSKEGLGGGKGSLLHAVRKTVTKSGTRLLKAWIASPSMSLEVINGRLDLVSQLVEDRILRGEIVNFLRRSHDSQRLVQKFSLGRGDADDLMSLLRTINATAGLVGVLQEHIHSMDVVVDAGEDRQQGSWQSIRNLISRVSLDGPNALAALITSSIDEESLMESHRIEENANTDIVALAQGILQNEGSMEDQAAMPQIAKSKLKQKATNEQDPEEQDTWILRRSASPVLERLHEALDHLRLEKTSLTARLRLELAAQSLSLRWTPGLGYICHVKGVKDVAKSSKTHAAARDVRKTKSTRSFHHPAWSDLGSKIDQAKLRIRAEEQRVFQELRQQVVKNLVQLRRNAAVLDELDIGCSFATIAEEQGFVRPVINLGFDSKIVKGRHPTVTMGLEEQGRAFVSNDCLIGEEERIWLITGPNMAGKSTFLRQNALISILAQVGSFVPAECAEIGLVDQIFTRVGSADNLFRDQSTFMVEMMETAAILNQATPQSFVIMDEIGRGTTPEDGVAVGFACLHHLYHKNRCRALFATHFHSLADMTKGFQHLGCYCTDVAEGSEGSFSFVHRLRKGVNRSSHALKVARLAGLPESAIETASTVLETLTSRRISTDQERQS